MLDEKERRKRQTLEHVLEHKAKVAQSAERRTFIASDWKSLLWVFCIMSVIGLVGETLQHFVAFNELESRPGFIWGPFSPIYGLAAVLLTVFLEPLSGKHPLVVFLVACIVGGGLEYFASWAMETGWGVVAWSYLDRPLNFNGRTDVLHCLVWGALGFLWVKAGLPLCNKVFEKINTQGKPYRIITTALAIFFALDIFVTCTVLLRADARAHDIPPQNIMEEYYDVHYPSDQLQKRFHNMGGLGSA